jgi:cell division control protein 6
MKKNPFELCESSLITDKYLNISYVPDELIGREEEINTIARIYRPLIDEGNHVNTLLIGNAGIGKTTLCRYIGKSLREMSENLNKNIEVFYFDCLNYNRPNSIVRFLSKSLLYVSKGFSQNVLLNKILIELKKREKNLFIILDEVHFLSSTSLNKILNISNAFGFHNSRISFLLATRTVDWVKKNKKVLDKLVRHTIEMSKYSKEEVFGVLKSRYLSSFRNGLIPDVIFGEIVSICHKKQNLRLGISMMKDLSLHADTNRKSCVDLNDFDIVFPNTLLNHSQLTNIVKDEHEYLILYALCLIEGEIKQTDLVDEYLKLKSTYDFEPLEISAMKRKIRRLRMLGVIKHKYRLPEGKTRGRESVLWIEKNEIEEMKIILKKCLENIKRGVGFYD